MTRRDRDLTAELVEWLEGRDDCSLDPGLSVAELDRAEAVLGLAVAPGWRAVLRRVHPVAVCDGTLFPDWRDPDGELTQRLVHGPVRGLLYDVEHNDFWWRDWGEAPNAMVERLAVAGRRLAAVPLLTPLFGHRYVADTDDSPIFSIVQADVYVPALSLADLVAGRSQSEVPAAQWPIGAVPFWSELNAYSQLGHAVEESGTEAAAGDESDHGVEAGDGDVSGDGAGRFGRLGRGGL